MASENPFAGLAKEPKKFLVRDVPLEPPKLETVRSLRDVPFSDPEQTFRQLGKAYAELKASPTVRGPKVREASFQNRLSAFILRYGFDRNRSELLRKMALAVREANPSLARKESFQQDLAFSLIGAFAPVLETRHLESERPPEGAYRLVGYNDFIDAAYATDLVAVDTFLHAPDHVQLIQLKLTGSSVADEKVDASIRRMQRLVQELGERESYLAARLKDEQSRDAMEQMRAIQKEGIVEVVMANDSLLDQLATHDPQDFFPEGTPTSEEIASWLERHGYVPGTVASLLKVEVWDRLCGAYADLIPERDRDAQAARLRNWPKVFRPYLAQRAAMRDQALKSRLTAETKRVLSKGGPETYEAVVVEYNRDLKRTVKAREPLTP